MTWTDLFPEATEEQQAIGWTIEYSFLEKVKSRAMVSGEDVSLEKVETVLLSSVEILGETYFPNAK